MFLGLRTIIYPAPDLVAAKAWFTSVLDIEPYFDQPFYVGYNVNGYELALDPNAEPTAGPMTYWGVANIDTALERLRSHGAATRDAVQNVGEGIRVATVDVPVGGVIALIENPHFQLPDLEPPTDGPGR